MSSTQQLLLGEGAGGSAPVFIEDVFSTYLYIGNGATQTITNNIDLSTKGGLTWIRRRGSATDHHLEDTVRGATKYLISNTTNTEQTNVNAITAFNSTGFSLGSYADVNSNAGSFVSWTFREQPKFFDVLTYTGNATAGRQISHNLGSTPGCIIVKRTSGAAEGWFVWHRGLNGNTGEAYLQLNTTAAQDIGNVIYYFGNDINFVAPTSTVFTVGSDNGINGTGNNYVAYLFAHDAGGFGLNGTDNVISCGSYTGTGVAGNTVTLGYEPQWVMFKRTSSTSNWTILDNMRGVATGGDDANLYPNLTDAEAIIDNVDFNATGFSLSNGSTPFNASGSTYIYIAIRRGPMAVPTLGTTVFSPNLRTTTEPNFVTNFVVDSSIYNYRPGDASVPVWTSRLLGGNGEKTSSTAAEVGLFGTAGYAFNTGVGTGSTANSDVLTWNFRRAPSFFDVVCYTGTGSATTFTHNLGVVPEMMLVKSRSNVNSWAVYGSGVDATSPQNYGLFLNTTDAKDLDVFWNNTAPTSTQFSVATKDATNRSGGTFVNYLFATCAGVSKVGSYTGNAGNTVVVPCGFTSGVRFVLIKRTDDYGDWYVWDSARGIIAGNDPYLLLNSTAAEVTGTDYVDTYSAGFEVTSTAPAGLNATGGTYIFLAIA